jgi:hypothetical protein
LKRESKEWQAFSDGLSHALDLPQADRAAWLATLAARDPELADAIVRVLASQVRDDFSGFLAEPLV